MRLANVLGTDQPCTHPRSVKLDLLRWRILRRGKYALAECDLLRRLRNVGDNYFFKTAPTLKGGFDLLRLRIYQRVENALAELRVAEAWNGL